MKYTLYIAIIIIIASCRNNTHAIAPEIDIHVNVLRSFDTIMVYRDSAMFKAYDVELSIKNTSNDTVSFWMLTCSWVENFIINNDYVDFIGPECDSNAPEVFTLKNRDKMILKGTVIKYNNTRYGYIKDTRFGFIYIDPVENRRLDDYFEIIGDKSKQDVILWSNSVRLK